MLGPHIDSHLLADIVLKQMPFSISWKDTRGNYLGCNDFFINLHDKENFSQIINQTDHDLYSIETANIIMHEDSQVLNTKQSLIFENELVLSNNKSLNLLSYKAPIFDQNNIIGIFCLSLDITKIKKEKNEIEHIFQNVLSALPEHIYWKDINGVILGCNDQQAISVGFKSHKEMIGKTPYDTLPKDQADVIHAIDMEIISSGLPKTITEESSRKDGTVAIYESKKVPLLDIESKKVVGLVGISFDITERINREEREKRAIARAVEEKAIAEAEAELRRAVTVLAGSIAHDMRIQLTSMMILTDLYTKSLSHVSTDLHNILQQEGKAVHPLGLHLEKLSEFPVKIKKVMHEMSQSINLTLKSMQRLVEGTLSYEDLIVCEIEQSLHDVLSKYPFKNNEKGRLHVVDIQNFSFLGCPILFYRIIFNLINNALQQIDKNGTGEIYIYTSNTNDFNSLRIRDTAGGAPPEIVTQLFDGYITTKKAGTGVGLAFCKLTMQSFNGDITCESRHGEYMEFILSFPRLDA